MSAVETVRSGKIVSEAGRRGNVTRPLTHSLDYGEEGLAMNATPYGECDPYEGDKYQDLALRIYMEAHEITSILPWIWFTTTCGTFQCVRAQHLHTTEPRKIAYPALLCIYCGLPGGTKDHLLPRGFTGDAQRHFVALVPACRQCNSIINDAPKYRVTERREIAHAGLRRRYAKVLQPVVSYKDFDGYLRSYVRAAHKKRDQVLARLDWPWDPDFDLRAFQKSGIEDPYALELI